jgi:hypothetical protein
MFLLEECQTVVRKMTMQKLEPPHRGIDIKTAIPSLWFPHYVPKLIDGNHPETFREGIEVPKEEPLRSTEAMNQDKGGGILLAVERHGVYEPWLIS